MFLVWLLGMVFSGLCGFIIKVRFAGDLKSKHNRSGFYQWVGYLNYAMLAIGVLALVLYQAKLGMGADLMVYIKHLFPIILSWRVAKSALDKAEELSEHFASRRKNRTVTS